VFDCEVQVTWEYASVRVRIFTDVLNVYNLKFCNKNAQIQVSNRTRLNPFVNKFGNNVFSTDGTVLFYEIYEVKVATDKKFIIEQHISRIKYINGVELKKKNQQQSTSKF